MLLRQVRANTSCVLSSCLHTKQTGGYRLVETIFEGLQERSKLKVTRRFTEVDMREEVIKVVRTKFDPEFFPNAVI